MGASAFQRKVDIGEAEDYNNSPLEYGLSARFVPTFHRSTFGALTYPVALQNAEQRARQAQSQTGPVVRLTELAEHCW